MEGANRKFERKGCEQEGAFSERLVEWMREVMWNRRGDIENKEWTRQEGERN